MAEVKGKRGLGFRDLHCFNLALLAGQIWRIITKPNLLMSKILKGKYFPNTSFWSAKCSNSASCIWKRLRCSKDLLEGGTIKRIGDGKIVRIWDDKWVLG
ncbi:hypothetical protein ACH5RR_003397 [Cinchona calisaya]|uniref:Uncharacterized protein n=1 Tax=Cinchona calisaya TaxID=153742 RepID=A0ABD3AV17_9GENT